MRKRHWGTMPPPVNFGIADNAGLTERLDALLALVDAEKERADKAEARLAGALMRLAALEQRGPPPTPTRRIREGRVGQ